MKTLVHIGSLVLALGAAGLLAGCNSHPETATEPARPAHDFEVVETSTKRLLGPKDMEILRAKVMDYLEQKGLTASGDYYVKVFLGPDQDGVSDDWVVVRLTLGVDMRFQLLGSTDSYYAGYRPYVAYDYYPYGYDNFTRLSFQYYDYYPYYGSAYYFPPPPRHHHKGGHDHDHDHDGDHNNDNPPGQVAFPFKPITPVGSPPRVTQTRWDGDSSGQNNQDNQNNQNGQNNRPRGNRGPRRGGQSTNPPAAQPAVQSEFQPAVQPAVQTVSQSGQPRNAGSSFATRSELYRNRSTRTDRPESTGIVSPPAQSATYTTPVTSDLQPAPESGQRRNAGNSFTTRSELYRNRSPRMERPESTGIVSPPAQSATYTPPVTRPARPPEQRRESGGATRSEVYRSQPARAERTESTRTESSSRSNNYTPPAARTESTRSNNSETPPRESGRSTFKPSGRGD